MDFRSAKMRNFKARVEESFPDNGDQAKQYLDLLYTTICDLVGNIRRNATLSLLLIAVFEFVEQSSSASFDLGGFHVGKNSAVLPLIPALTAYFFLEIVIGGGQFRDRRDIFTEIFKRWSPKAGGNDLGTYVLPSTYLFWNTSPDRQRVNRTSVDKVEVIVSRTLALTILFAVFLFEGQAYYVLPKGDGISFYVIYSLSLLATIFFLSMVITFLSLND